MAWATLGKFTGGFADRSEVRMAATVVHLSERELKDIAVRILAD
jgi:hypothetical protein